MVLGSDRAHRPAGGGFRALWAAAAASNLGDGVALTAAPLLATALTREPALVAGLAFAQRLPWLIFPLVSGALADRLDRRRVMVAVAVGRAVLFALLGLAVLFDRATLPLLYVLFFLLGAGETLFDTAATSLVPSVVAREELAGANARLAGTLVVANRFVGPPLGGLLFGVALALPFMAGAGGLAAAALLLLALRGSFRPERAVDEASKGLVREIGEGLRWLWRHRLLRTIALALALLNLTLVAWSATFVLYAEERLGLGPAGYGLLLTANAGGAVLGSAVAGRVIARFGMSRVLRFGLFMEAASPAMLAVAGAPWIAAATLAMFGVHAMIWGALIATLRQESTPDRLQGRVASAYRLIEEGAAAPGAIIGGVLAARLGLAAPFWLNAAVAVLLIPVLWPAFSAARVAEARRAG